MRLSATQYAVRSCLYPVRARAYGGLARIERAATVIGQPAAAPPRGHYWSTGRLISRIGRRGSRCAAPLVLRRIVDDLPLLAVHACMEESEQRDYPRPAPMTTTTTGTMVRSDVWPLIWEMPTHHHPPRRQDCTTVQTPRCTHASYPCISTAQTAP